MIYYRPRPLNLKLGEVYVIHYDYNKKMVCKFIQPTKCGFNFLNLETSKCVLKQHLYPSKCHNHLIGDWFWVNNILKIDKYEYN